jgi:CheY-like chemotaxis protein
MRVLCIDDDELNRRVLEGMLAVAGAELVEASDGATGLRLIGSMDLDAVMLDLRMPKMDGIEIARCIRQMDDARSKLPIVMITADTGAHVRADCLGAGADEVIHKPVVMSVLFEVLGEALAARARG